MILPSDLPLTAYRNGEFRTTVQMEDAGLPIVLTGFAPAMQIRNRPGLANTPLLSLTDVPTANGSVLTVAGVLGQVEILINRLDWGGLPFPLNAAAFRDFAYDIVLTDPLAGPAVYAGGVFKLYEGVTR